MQNTRLSLWRTLAAGIRKAKEAVYEYEAHLSCGIYTYPGIILPAIIEYRKLNPKVSINMEMAGPAASLDVDFCFYSNHGMSFRAKKGEYGVTVPLFREKYKLFAAKNLVDIPEEQTSIDLGLLKDIPFIKSDNDEIFSRDMTYEICWAAGFVPKIYTNVTNFNVKIYCIDMGEAVSIMPESCAGDARLLTPNIRVLDIDNYDVMRAVIAMRKKRRILSDTALDFWKFILDWFGVRDEEKD